MKYIIQLPSQTRNASVLYSTKLKENISSFTLKTGLVPLKLTVWVYAGHYLHAVDGRRVL